jgi:hypothetical protein
MKRRFNVDVPEELQEKFRREVGRRFGEKKGNLRKAVIEALELWIDHSPAKREEAETE